MRVVRERHQHRGCRLQQIRTEIAKSRRRAASSAVLCARAHDHGAHPRLVETVADPHDAHCPGWRFDRWTVIAALHRHGGVRRRAGAARGVQRHRAGGRDRGGLSCIGESIRDRLVTAAIGQRPRSGACRRRRLGAGEMAAARRGADGRARTTDRRRVHGVGKSPPIAALVDDVVC